MPWFSGLHYYAMLLLSQVLLRFWLMLNQIWFLYKSFYWLKCIKKNISIGWDAGSFSASQIKWISLIIGNESLSFQSVVRENSWISFRLIGESVMVRDRNVPCGQASCHSFSRNVMRNMFCYWFILLDSFFMLRINVPGIPLGFIPFSSDYTLTTMNFFRPRYVQAVCIALQ